jgi:hypothetical protein
LSTASPTGRPRDFSSGLRKPVTTSCAAPFGRPHHFRYFPIRHIRYQRADVTGETAPASDVWDDPPYIRAVEAGFARTATGITSRIERPSEQGLNLPAIPKFLTAIDRALSTSNGLAFVQASRHQTDNSLQQAYGQGCRADRKAQIGDIPKGFPLLRIKPCHCFFHDPTPS